MAAALANPQRRIRKLWLTENAARRLADDKIELRVTPEIVRPSLIDARLGPDAVHQGLLAEAEPLDSPDIGDLPQEGIILVLDQITDPHNVGAILRSAAAFAVKAIVTTARHSPEATGVLAKSASGALELVPLVTVIKSGARAERIERPGFYDRRARQRGQRGSRRDDPAAAAGAGARRRGPGLATIDPRDLQRGGAARHARRNQEPQRVQCGGAGALYRRLQARPDDLVTSNARSRDANGLCLVSSPFYCKKLLQCRYFLHFLRLFHSKENRRKSDLGAFLGLHRGIRLPLSLSGA